MRSPKDPIAEMLEACPFLRAALGRALDEPPTVVMGAVARLLREGALTPEQQARIFAYWNTWAERADERELDLLATGALETFNDDAASQQLARALLTGKALDLLEDMRSGWGQPDYGPGD
ncbi:MAG: hypothetical protein J0L52_05685 [Caulobacterales bacterium]|nr:hypothetical protein [Caulobacterales bacterium]